jgi:hypothetical protein
VLTRYPDGHSAVHQLHPDGIVALLRQPSTSSGPASPRSREHRCSSERTVRAANPRACALVATAWKQSRGGSLAMACGSCSARRFSCSSAA